MTRHRVVEDLGPSDFEGLREALVARGWGPTTLHNEIGKIRVLFRWVYESGLIDRPLRFGPGFKRPSARTMRLARQAKGPQLFEADELRRIIDAAPKQIKAMTYLGINCGLGNADCGRMARGHVDLKAGWLDFPRPKTAVPRRCPLWPETVEAISDVLTARNVPDDADEVAGQLVFITKYGRPWFDETRRASPISAEFAKVMRSLKLRNGRNFYALRHTFETIGGESRDQVAVDAIMGHTADPRHRRNYRERVSDERLVVVTEHVRSWLLKKSS